MFCRFPVYASGDLYGKQAQRVSKELVSGTYFDVLGSRYRARPHLQARR